ncbi:2917_t:CDS:2 [Funneliformis geosporum]|uniref:anthranilate synthase n=1 Tax=Funneliformis geosporum TaxID=1117311 RepID=A0A9W4WNJ9_9GLOM|nr:2917_t:CDS:2 [Funneliformis geosporum]
MTITFKPSLQEIHELISQGNTIPVYAQIPADLLTPVIAYLRLVANGRFSFLFESVAGGEKIGRYSFIGADPYKILKTGENEAVTGDPLIALEKELKNIKFVSIPGIPSFTGGAIGYIAYDCVKYFEPRTARELHDPFGLPDSVFLFCDTLIIFDHIYQLLNVVSHYRSDSTDPKIVETQYHLATEKIRRVLNLLQTDLTPSVPQKEIRLNQTCTSNVGKKGYETFVTQLKKHIKNGDIIQAVPSQRLTRYTTLHPFNVYRYLRTLNPSPYMFYIDLEDYQIVGASPELLVKVEDDMVYTHPIAGTRKRGKTKEEDEKLVKELLNDPKERAEHIMLVDLGRNDVNRVCQPETVKVDSLMQVEKYSHVMHIVSQVSGKLRPEKTRFDAFRSIFPASTVSGAPKIRAMELIAELEQEKRGVYAGAVGHFDFANSIDTCISIRTMLFKNGVAYLQAGGIVYDSLEEDEYQETINKLKSNVTCIDEAEKYYYNLQNQS